MKVTTRKSSYSEGSDIFIDGERVGSTGVKHEGDRRSQVIGWKWQVESAPHRLASAISSIVYSTEIDARTAAVAHCREQGASRSPERDAELARERLTREAHGEAVKYGRTIFDNAANGRAAVVIYVDENGNMGVGCSIGADLRDLLIRALAATIVPVVSKVASLPEVAAKEAVAS